MPKATAQKPVWSLKFPPSLYFLACFFIGAFSGAFLAYQLTADNYSPSECFLVHEALDNEPAVLGGSDSALLDGAKRPAMPSPSAGRAPSSESGRVAPSLPRSSQLVNLNTASLDELDSLPGIGPVYAQRIIDGRPYSSKEEILRVKGIGAKTYQKLKDLISVD